MPAILPTLRTVRIFFSNRIKKSAIALLVFSLAALNGMYAQSVARTFKGESLDKALKELVRKYDLKVSYSPSLLKGHVLSGTVEAESPEAFVRALFQNQPFQIKDQGKLLLVVPVQKKKVSGQVVDRSSGAPLAFALVQSAEKSTVADQNGFFSLPSPMDSVMLSVSYLGYEKIRLNVPAVDERLQVTLEQNPQILQEVILDVTKQNELSYPVSAFTLNPRQFNSLPALGETDVFKTLQLLPGISATDESTAGFNVRGSAAAQNLVLMDGFTLYHLDHFFGIFSTLNPNVINSIDIYKGGFGAEYGGRTSSVVDVSSRQSTGSKVRGGGGVNFLSTNLYIDLPIGKRINLLAGIRNSFTSLIESGLYSDFLSSSRQNFISAFDDPELTALELAPSLRFYDFNAKVTARPTDKTTIRASMYVSEDEYNGSFSEIDEFAEYSITDAAKWSNGGLNLSVDQELRQNQLLGFSLSASEYSISESLNNSFTNSSILEFSGDTIPTNTLIQGSEFQVNNRVSDVNLKFDYTRFLDRDSEFKAGMEVNGVETTFNSNLQFQDFFSDSTEVSFGDTIAQEGTSTSFFSSFSTRVGKFYPTLGIRGSHYDGTDKWYAEPRFNLSYRLSNKVQLKGAYSLHNQFLNQSSLSFINSGRYYWILSNSDLIPVIRSRHAILGAHYAYQKWRLEAEVYRRRTSGLLANRYLILPAEFFIATEENFRLDGINISQGLELFLKYKSTKYNAWVSYTLASSRNKYEFLNDNKLYPSDEDQRHEINWVNVLKVKKWEISSTLIYGSGRPFTPAVGTEEIANTFVYEDLTKVNTDRFSPYRRVDISAKYTFSLARGKGEIGASIFNLFNFRNIKSRRYVRQFIFSEQFDNTVEDQVKIVPLDTYLLGFTPNLFFNVNF
ncbi:MAG: TonB-dependent receptor plug domain-containing protein [Bacteroidota bacterium]